MTLPRKFDPFALPKRAFDLAVSTTGLLLIWPLFVIISIAVKVDSPGPIFFLQNRVGLGESVFRIIKFRTMIANAESFGLRITESGNARVTRVGKILRKWKLDELPQLMNVFLGDMSIVGPRPEVPEFVNLVEPKKRALLFSIRPGITDYATIKFRYEEELLSTVEDPETYYVTKILPAKYKMHEKYILERHFWMDLKIIGYTFYEIVKIREPQDDKKNCC